MKITLVFLLVFLFFFTFTANAISFPLPSANFVQAKMPMKVVYPRPDTETQIHSRHRWAHPAMSYEIPIGVQGGAWPFKYEIVSGPNGATIGQNYGEDNYGVITWTPTTSSGVESFTVKITDQQLNTVSATWNVTIDADQFIFVQDGFTGTKLGTITQPLESWADWYMNDANNSIYANKIVVFRGGSYSIIGDPNQNGNIEINTGVKSPSIIGFPGELPVMDCSAAKIFTRGGANVKDIFVADIRWEHSRQDVNNAHFFWATGDVTRSTWFRNYFYDHGPGIKGTDNTTAVFVSSTATHKNNILYKNNTHDNFHNTGSNGSYVDIYYSSYVLIESNIAKNSNNQYGFWPKATTSFVTVRANSAYENITNGGITVGYGSESPEVAHDHEICWNRIRLPTGSSSHSLLFAGSNQYINRTYHSYIYRNTFVNGSSWVRFSGNEPFEVDSNVVISDHLDRWNTSIMRINHPNLTGNENTGITDLTGSLVGQYRLDYLGVVGHEVSDVYLTTPKAVTKLSVE
jgi:hypothetical protein